MRQLCCLFLSFVCFAGTPTERMPIHIGTLDVAPYGFTNHAGKPSGAFVELVNRIAARADVLADNALYPTARLYALLQQRQLDLALTSMSLDQTAGYVDLGKLWRFRGVILYRKQLGLAPQKLDDFKPYLIGRLNETCRPLKRDVFRVYELSDLSQGVKMMVAGRLDGLCGEMGGIRPALTNLSASEMSTLALPFEFLTADVRLYANPALPKQTLDKLKRAVTDIVKEGEAERIIVPYMLQKAPKSAEISQ